MRKYLPFKLHNDLLCASSAKANAYKHYQGGRSCWYQPRPISENETIYCQILSNLQN